MKRASIYIISAFLILLSCLAGGQNLKEKSEPHVKLGVSFMQEGNYTEALRELFEAEKIYPDNSTLQNVLGLTLWLKKDFERAKQHLEKAVALDPHNSEAYNNLGVVYLNLEKWDDAISCFEKTMSDILYLTPENSWFNIGVAYENKNDYTKAIESYKKAAELAPTNPRIYEVYKRLGRVYYHSGKYLDAVSTLEKARNLNKNDAETRLFLGQSYIKVRQNKNAIGEFKEVLRLDPNGRFAREAGGYLKLLQ